MILVVVSVAGVLLAFGALLAGAVLARHRAGAAADLAALAAAAPSLGQPCEGARRIAEANGSRLSTCRILDDGSVLVGVEVWPAGEAGNLFGPARGWARARAGP